MPEAERICARWQAVAPPHFGNCRRGYMRHAGTDVYAVHAAAQYLRLNTRRQEGSRQLPVHRYEIRADRQPRVDFGCSMRKSCNAPFCRRRP